MGLKKKKNIIVMTLAAVCCFILYQLYFFMTITAESSSGKHVIHIIDHNNVLEVAHHHSEDDKFINEHGFLRGVLIVNMPRYRPDSQNQFKCLKSEQLIPFENVNDDYCDCEDASDEPSTNACSKGFFYCQTQYKSNKPVSLNYISSSMVNDGICDCCDGSDEWLHDPDRKLLTQTQGNKRYFAQQCLNICN